MSHSEDNNCCNCSYCQQAKKINNLSTSEKTNMLHVLVSDMSIEKIRELDQLAPAVDFSNRDLIGKKDYLNSKSIEEQIKELEKLNTAISNIFGVASPRLVH